MLDVTTTVNGTIWPGIPGPFASQLLAMQCQFESTQWLSAEELLARQSRQLGRLLAHAYDTTPFYRRRLDAVQLSPDRVNGPNEWVRIPLLTRADLQQHQPDMLSRPLDISQIALACVLGYADFRFADCGWRKAYPKLDAFHQKMLERPSIKISVPPPA